MAVACAKERGKNKVAFRSAKVAFAVSFAVRKTTQNTSDPNASAFQNSLAGSVSFAQSDFANSSADG